jgi:hypothetical protein
MDDGPREPADPFRPHRDDGEEGKGDPGEAHPAQDPLLILGEHQVGEQDDERRRHHEGLGKNGVQSGEQRLWI